MVLGASSFYHDYDVTTNGVRTYGHFEGEHSGAGTTFSEFSFGREEQVAGGTRSVQVLFTPTHGLPPTISVFVTDVLTDAAGATHKINVSVIDDPQFDTRTSVFYSLETDTSLLTVNSQSSYGTSTNTAFFEIADPNEHVSLIAAGEMSPDGSIDYGAVAKLMVTQSLYAQADVRQVDGISSRYGEVGFVQQNGFFKVAGRQFDDREFLQLQFGIRHPTTGAFAHGSHSSGDGIDTWTGYAEAPLYEPGNTGLVKAGIDLEERGGGVVLSPQLIIPVGTKDHGDIEFVLEHTFLWNNLGGGEFNVSIRTPIGFSHPADDAPQQLLA